MLDKRDEYFQEVSEKLDEVIALCESHGIPIAVLAQLSDTAYFRQGTYDCVPSGEVSMIFLYLHILCLMLDNGGIENNLDSILTLFKGLSNISGHDSTLMRFMGVPSEPASPEALREFGSIPMEDFLWKYGDTAVRGMVSYMRTKGA